MHATILCKATQKFFCSFYLRIIGNPFQLLNVCWLSLHLLALCLGYGFLSISLLLLIFEFCAFSLL